MKTNLNRRFFLPFLLLFGLIASIAQAQDATVAKKNVYTTSGGELIFSWSNTKSGGNDATSITRFSPFFNLQNQLHMDRSDYFGFFTGLNIRNVGFIWDDPNNVNTRYKMRTYTLGLPLAIKVGNMTGVCFFAGYELELPFNYKEKKFVNEDKVSKSSDWFSSKTPGLYQSVFVGIQTPFGSQLKFKYYMTNFVNKSYAANDGAGNTIYPYQNLDANVFYISLSVQILKGTHLSYK